MKTIFMIIFISIDYMTQIFIVIGIVIDNFISNTRRYKLTISYIKQAIIDLNVFI